MNRAVHERLATWHAVEQSDEVPLGCRSFCRDPDARRTPVLLLHGAGGSPADFHELASDLARHGIPNLCPLLPAHGRGEAGHARIRFGALAERAFEAYDALASDGSRPALVGQSLGAVLAIRLAAERSPAALVALAPALRPFVLRRALRLVPALFVRPRLAIATWRWQTRLRRDIRATAARIAEVRCPLLVLHSRDDASVSPRGARELADRAGSEKRRLVWLDGQGHVLSMAPDRERVFAPLRELLLDATPADRSGRTDPPRADA